MNLESIALQLEQTDPNAAAYLRGVAVELMKLRGENRLLLDLMADDGMEIECEIPGEAERLAYFRQAH